MRSSSLREEFHLSSITLNYPDPTCFHISQWNVPSWAYIVWRLFWCVWHVTWLVISGVRTQNTAPDDEDGVKWFVYASNWTFLLTTFFCLLDFVLVVSHARARSRQDNISKNSDQAGIQARNEKEEILFQGEFTLVEGIKTQVISCSNKLQWSLFEAVNCVNLLTTIAFWTSQFQDGDHIHADVVVFHIINTVFVIANTMFTAIPVRILHFIYPAIFIAVYFFFNLIYYLADGTSIGGSDVTFRPLEWDEAYPTAFTIIAGFLVFIPLGHLAFFSLFTLRIYLADKFGSDYGSGPELRGNSETDQHVYSSGTYRKREATIEDGGANYERRGQGHLEKSARVNQGFEMELNNRT